VSGPLDHSLRSVWSAVNSIRLKPSVATLAARLACFDNSTLFLVVGELSPYIPEASAREPSQVDQLLGLTRLQWLSSVSALCRLRLK